MPFTWDIGTARYRDTDSGQFMSRENVRGYLGESLAASQDVGGDIADALLTGQVSVADWRDQFRLELKDEYIRQYLLGRGGLGQMDQAAWGQIGGMLKEQYGYLESWVAELEGADLADMPEGAFKNRARMYVNSAREGYERGLHRAVLASGQFSEERWVLSDAEHCDGCIDLAGRGWVPLGSLGAYPGDGSTPCLSNCKCHKEYR